MKTLKLNWPGAVLASILACYAGLALAHSSPISR